MFYIAQKLTLQWSYGEITKTLINNIITIIAINAHLLELMAKIHLGRLQPLADYKLLLCTY